MRFMILAVASVLWCDFLTAQPSQWVDQVTAPILLSGQSNARELAPYLARHATVIGDWQGGTSITAWAIGGPLWERLRPSLQPTLRAIVWWQGETDQIDAEATHTVSRFARDYPEALTDLIWRMRHVPRAIHDHNILVVICGAVTQEPLRTIQVQWAEGMFAAVFVPSSDLPNDGALHLVPAGYEGMAVRVMDAIRRGWKQP